MGGIALYGLYGLLGRDPKKVELEDELHRIKVDETSRDHWALMREAAESFIDDEAYAKLSAAEQSAAHYRYVERRYESRIKGAHARVKVLEAQIRKEDDERLVKERARAADVDDAAVREQILKFKLEDANKEIESLKSLLDAQTVSDRDPEGGDGGDRG